MSILKVQGNASGTGTFTIAAPNSNNTQTLTLPDQTGTILTNVGPFTANTSASNGAVTIDASNNLQFNSGYGSTATAYGCRVWVNFNGTTSPGTIRASGNVTSVTKGGTGNFTINFTNALVDSNYAVVGTAGVGGFNGVYVTTQASDASRGTNSTTATQIFSSVGGNSSGGAYDATWVSIAIFR